MLSSGDLVEIQAQNVGDTILLSEGEHIIRVPLVWSNMNMYLVIRPTGDKMETQTTRSTSLSPAASFNPSTPSSHYTFETKMAHKCRP